jgi:hypothetical protein
MPLSAPLYIAHTTLFTFMLGQSHNHHLIMNRHNFLLVYDGSGKKMQSYFLSNGVLWKNNMHVAC